MRPKRAYPYARCRTFGIGVHNLLRLVIHLHLFLGVAVIGENVYLRYHVIGQLVWKFTHRGFFALNQLAVLCLQFGHGSSSCATRALVTRHANALNVRQLFQRLQHNHHHNRGAIGVSHDATRTV